MRLSKALKGRHREEISKRIPCILIGFRLVEDFALLLIAIYVFFAHELNDAPNRPHRCLSSRFLFYLAELKENCIYRKLESQTIMHEMLCPCKYFPSDN